MSSPITKVSVRDVRTLSGTHHAELSRITLLVGENSVGKSTFLGCLNALGHLAGLHELNDSINYFNQSPFYMGSFESIARTECDSFSVSINLDSGFFRQFSVNFAKGSSDIPIQETGLHLQIRENTRELDPKLSIIRKTSKNDLQQWHFDGPEFQFHLNRSEVSYSQFTSWLSRSVTHGYFPFSGDQSTYKKRMENPSVQELAAFTKFINFFQRYFQGPQPLHSITAVLPHELKRERQYHYNPIEILSSSVDISTINNFGRKLGLFRQLKVKKTSHDQFEVLINVSGSFHNLIDVGFGVTSLLPLIATICNVSSRSLFLLQQPEVHVHPSAQADLIKMISRSDHSFVIETHSDHIIAWLRILVKEKVLEPSDVAIIYFERVPEDESSSYLHQISLDQHANLIGQPKSYRQFFSTETNRLLGFPI